MWVHLVLFLSKEVGKSRMTIREDISYVGARLFKGSPRRSIALGNSMLSMEKRASHQFSDHIPIILGVFLTIAFLRNRNGRIIIIPKSKEVD